MIRSKTAVLARDVVGSISIQRELREVMRFMTKSVIERMLDDEETMRGLSGLPNTNVVYRASTTRTWRCTRRG